MYDLDIDQIQAQRGLMTECAESGYDLPATANQIRYLADLLALRLS